MKPIWTQAEPGAAYSVPKRSSWLIYAMGGGWGHLTRSLALARVAASKYDVHILTNSPYADLVTNSPVWQNDNFKGINIIKPESIRSQSNESTSTSKHNPAELLAAEIEAIVERHAISFLVVDTFPRGILGELPQLLPRLGKTNLVLVQRDISPDYSSKYICSILSDRITNS